MAIQLPDPDARNETQCQNCGDDVSHNFRLTYGDNDNLAHRCFECDTKCRVGRGTAAGLEVKLPDPQNDAQKQHLVTSHIARADGGEPR